MSSRNAMAAAILLLTLGGTIAAGQTSGPYSIPISSGTGQKPQSKLWHDQGTWWAALPQEKGVYLWRLIDGRFQPQDQPGPLKGTTSKRECDVVLAGGMLFILAFEPGGTESTLHALKWEKNTYQPAPGYPVALKHDAKVETIVCDIDAKGTLWFAWVNDALEVVATSFNSQDIKSGFTKSTVLGKGVGRDDIAAVVAFKGHVGVMWSNSKEQKFYFRAHRDGEPEDKWLPPEIPAAGKGVVNDHINLAADGQGNVWSVTKAATGIGVSAVQLTLRRRNSEGKWDKSYDVLPAGGKLVRTRPVVALDAAKPFAYVMCSDKTNPTAIYLRAVRLTDGKAGNEIKALSADYSLNNATDAKAMVSDATWLVVLAGPAEPGNGPARFGVFLLKDLRFEE